MRSCRCASARAWRRLAQPWPSWAQAWRARASARALSISAAAPLRALPWIGCAGVDCPHVVVADVEWPAAGQAEGKHAQRRGAPRALIVVMARAAAKGRPSARSMTRMSRCYVAAQKPAAPSSGSLKNTRHLVDGRGGGGLGGMLAGEAQKD